MNIKEIQKFKDQLLDEIQNTFSDKKNPSLLEYQQQTENLITLKELLEREKESMPQENFDLISGSEKNMKSGDEFEFVQDSIPLLELLEKIVVEAEKKRQQPAVPLPSIKKKDNPFSLLNP